MYIAEKAMATHSCTLTWRLPWTEGPGGLYTTERLHFHVSLSCVEEGNGNPLQYYCLKNLIDKGAWQATAQRVAKSQNQLSMPTL